MFRTIALAAVTAALLVTGCSPQTSGGGGDADGAAQNQNVAPDDNENANDSPPVQDGERYPTGRPRLNGTTYYVAPNGNDANPGTIDSPWATVQHAAEMMTPGDIVYLRDGVYHESVLTAGSGTADGDIVFAAYSGERPILDGTGVDANNGFIIAHDYIVLQGLTLRNWPEDGVWIENAAWPYLIDCEVYDVSSGIGASEGTHDFVFDHVTAHDFDLYGFDASPGDTDCYNGVFWQCVAHTGRDPDQNVDGFALGHGTQHGFRFYRCETYGVFDGFDISSRDTSLERCSAHHCSNAGFKIWQDDVTLVNCLGYESTNANMELDWDGDPGTVTVQNCTFVGSDTYNIWIENSGDALRMSNTIMGGGRELGLVFEQHDISNYAGDYNLFQHETARAFIVGFEEEYSVDQLDAWRAQTGQDAHSLTASSLSDVFVGPAGFDFHLAADSPAGDSGSSEGAPTDDYDGAVRPQGEGIDIGAFER